MTYIARYIVGFTAAALLEATMLIVCAMIDREEFRVLFEVWRETAPVRSFAKEFAENA